MEVIIQAREFWAKLGNNSESAISKASEGGAIDKGSLPFLDPFLSPLIRGLFKGHTQNDRERLSWLPSLQDADGVLNICEVSSSKEKLLTHTVP